MRFKLTVEYEGTAYHGWQAQAGGVRTVQAVLEEAVEKLVGVRTRMKAAGRTDAGVHALGQVVSFRTDKPIRPEALARALNALTPPDIAVWSVEIVPEEFDPRRWASSRTYLYRIWNNRAPSVFWRRYSWHVALPLDVAAMAEASRALVGEHDFAAFQVTGSNAPSSVRRVLRSDLSAEPPLIEYAIEATGFLRRMVRRIVGGLVEVGLGTRSVGQFRDLVAGSRDLPRLTAPAHGLCLVAVQYPEEPVSPGGAKDRAGRSFKT